MQCINSRTYKFRKVKIPGQSLEHHLPRKVPLHCTDLCNIHPQDKDVVTLTTIQDQIGDWLKLTSFASEETNTLIILDDCPTSRDVK